MKIDPTQWEDVTDLLTPAQATNEMVLEIAVPIADYVALEEHAQAHQQSVGDAVRFAIRDAIGVRAHAVPETKGIIARVAGFWMAGPAQSQAPRTRFVPNPK